MSQELKATADDQFQTDVLESELPVLVDFWAEWCGPCRMVTPVLEKLAKEYKGRVNFFKLNVDHNPNTSAQYGVRSIPYLVLFAGGKVVASEVGAKTESQLSAFLDEHV